MSRKHTNTVSDEAKAAFISSLTAYDVLDDTAKRAVIREADDFGKDLFRGLALEAQRSYYLAKAANAFLIQHLGYPDPNKKPRRTVEVYAETDRTNAFAISRHLRALKYPPTSLGEVKEKRVILKRISSYPLFIGKSAVAAWQTHIDREEAELRAAKKAV